MLSKYPNCTLTYIDYETFPAKSKRATMNVKRMRTIATEIFKTINGFIPEAMKEICVKKVNPSDRTNGIIVRGYLTTA